MNNLFDHVQEDLGSILGRVIPTTSKVVFDASLLSNQVRIKATWSNLGKGEALFFTTRCSNYWKCLDSMLKNALKSAIMLSF